MHKWLYISLVTLLASCQNISCPLDNTVMMKVCMYAGEDRITVGDTLTVTMAGTDSVLINKLYRFSEFEVPVRHGDEGAAQDTLVLNWHMTVPEGMSPVHLTDTLFVDHSCYVHFETYDCPPAVFHKIVEARTTHILIDDIDVTHTAINYDKSENIRVHLRVATE